MTGSGAIARHRRLSPPHADRSHPSHSLPLSRHAAAGAACRCWCCRSTRARTCRAGRRASRGVPGASRCPAEVYHRFMDAGFRRSGKLVYQPVCRGCRACVPLRVPVATFRRASRSGGAGGGTQDLRVTVGRAGRDARRSSSCTAGTSPTGTARTAERGGLGDVRVVPVRLAGRDRRVLLPRRRRPAAGGRASATCAPQSLSSVYFYLDPAEPAAGWARSARSTRSRPPGARASRTTTSATGSAAAARCSTRRTSARARCCTPTACGGRLPTGDAPDMDVEPCAHVDCKSTRR